MLAGLEIVEHESLPDAPSVRDLSENGVHTKKTPPPTEAKPWWLG